MIPQGPGATVSAIVGIVLSVLLVNAALVGYTWLRTPAVAERTRPSGTPTVTCPDCGTTNDPEYRYCRACVAELPGYTTNRSALASPFGGLTR